MELPETAARALATVRRDGADLSFPVDEICHSKRFRLSVRYRAPSGEPIRLGLLYAEDRAALEALARALAAEAAPATQGAPPGGCTRPGGADNDPA
ncbi:hypothetical protein [Anaeromyxobacter diazotrophicus]|uniref:hypothetical protein n=1 Tax=Anaeromyxobacter diazotrophicus TaxID=2590199 RepID=UPI001590926F|nr:hypothetical protein [Anaeromyxobacter diazotrophicus]